MAETTDKKTRKEGAKAKETVQIETGSIDTEEAIEFSPEETARMLKVKAEIAKGHYSDITNEHKKLLFVQWMIEHGKLNS